MNFRNSQRTKAILISILIAMLLRILPLPRDWLVFNPDWILLVIIYWCLYIPDRFNIGSAWIFGLLTDVLTGQLLGQQALVYSIIAYIVVRLHQRIRLFPLSQKTLIILFLLLLGQTLIFWIQNVQSPVYSGWNYMIPAFTGTLAWPLVYISLGGLHHSEKID
jgi:rod shape-determining protein MreD